MSPRSAVGLLLLLALPGASRAADSICIGDVPKVLIGWHERVPLGCAVIDCCPGCPQKGTLDWRVRVAGDAIAGVDIGISPAGDAGEPLSAPRGETLFRGIGRLGGNEPPPIATLHLRVDADAPPQLGPVSIDIEQLLGGIVVNEFQMEWNVVACASAASPPCDTIATTGNADADRSVILLDGCRGADPARSCVDDEQHRVLVTESVGNLWSAKTCHSEVAVFSEANQMALVENVATWTDACGDTLPVALDPILVAPTNVFLPASDPITDAFWGGPARDVVAEDLANANQIYDQNKTGISFVLKPHELDTAAKAELAAKLPSAFLIALWKEADLMAALCALPADFKSKGWYVAGELNVYYVLLPITGLTCESDRNVIFVGVIEKPETLAHELGHSLALIGKWGHTNTAPGFDAHNVMWTDDSTLRDRFSLGQAFRQNVEEQSTLNTNHVRTGPVRACLPDAFVTPACPPLWLDWSRP